MYQITKTIEFEAAHFLREYNGKCETLHGHRWKVTVGLIFTKTNKIGISFDFTKLKKIMHTYISNRYDHTLLNEIDPFNKINPTAENIAKTIFQTLLPLLPPHKTVWVEVWESPTSSARYWE